MVEMKAIGIVFLYDRVMGAPDTVSKEFSEYFPGISEDLVKSKLLNLLELKTLLESKMVFWGGVTEKFYEFLDDEVVLGSIAIKVFENHSPQKAGDEVKCLIYDREKTPWKFTIAVCVVYN